MSELTPETAATMIGEDAMDEDATMSMSGESAVDDSEEPSMEDILASIRKIITDNSDPVPLDGPATSEALDVLIPAPATPASMSDMSPVEENVDLSDMAALTDLDANELDIEALLSDIQVAEPETPPQPLVAVLKGGMPPFNTASPAPGLDDELSIPDFNAESDVPVSDVVAAVVEDSDDEMDRLMSEMLKEMDALPAQPIAQTAPNPESLSAPDAPITLDTSDADELDLVKSLMANLTDEDEDEKTAPDMLAVDSIVQGDGDIPPNVATMIEDPESNILDSILDMTLADEIATGPDADAVSDAESAEADAIIPTPTADVAPDDDAPSLFDIATAAEAEVSTELSDSEGDDDAVAAAVALLFGGATDDTEAETANTENAAAKDAAETPTSHPSDSHNQDIANLETPMPRAVRSDAILDGVTEEATMSAFARLNQVVEDKAVLTERGPRIGDLVQDALKPMLKEWLDENLQAIVERAVAKEVKRLSSGK